MSNEKMILGTNSAGLKQIQKNNGNFALAFIGMIGLICMFCGAVLVGLLFLAGAGFGIYAIKKYIK